MPTDNPAGSDLTALRDALLTHYEEELHNLPLTAARVAARLDRVKLGWLLGPWFFFGLVRNIPRVTNVTKRSASQQRLVRLYVQASGHDPDVSRAEVHRIQGQLQLIDGRSPNWLRPEFAGCRPASLTELEATADALLAYYLGGRQTNDALLAATQAAYAAHEEELQAHTTVLAEQGLRAAKRHDKASRQQGIGTLRRYVTTWRGWLDQAQGQQAPMPADSPTKNSAGDLAALRQSLLDELLLDDDLASPTMRAATWIHERFARFKLGWLAVPVAIVGSLGQARVTLANDVRIMGLYRRLSGKDADVAMAEVLRIRLQLSLVACCLPQDAGSSAASPSSASRTELQAATDALLVYFLGGRQTDDALLAEAQAAYAGYEQLRNRQTEADAGHGFLQRRARRRRHRDGEREDEHQLVQARERYIQTWRRWFEHEAGSQPSSL
jgi:hypothetical protein